MRDGKRPPNIVIATFQAKEKLEKEELGRVELALKNDHNDTTIEEMNERMYEIKRNCVSLILEIEKASTCFFNGFFETHFTHAEFEGDESQNCQPLYR